MTILCKLRLGKSLSRFGKGIRVTEHQAETVSIEILQGFSGSLYDTNQVLEIVLRELKELYPVIDAIHSDKGIFKLTLRTL